MGGLGFRSLLGASGGLSNNGQELESTIGFRIEGLGFRVEGLGFRVEG